jgi:hypothetical protein
MNAFFKPNTRFSRPKILIRLVFICIALFCAFTLFGCKKSVSYADYVSEYRSNIFLAKTDTLSLRVYSVNKETPYAADGVPQETSPRTEVYLVAPEGDKICTLFFTVGGKEYGGEMSYDNVKAEYFYACSLDVSKVETLPCRIEYGKQSLELNALSIRQENTLSAQEILNKLKTVEGELFESLTDKYGFAGEIYIRLIYEENPYYYVGIIDRNGNIHAFLLNAQTGKILAKRTS